MRQEKDYLNLLQNGLAKKNLTYSRDRARNLAKDLMFAVQLLIPLYSAGGGLLLKIYMIFNFRFKIGLLKLLMYKHGSFIASLYIQRYSNGSYRYSQVKARFLKNAKCK